MGVHWRRARQPGFRELSAPVSAPEAVVVRFAQSTPPIRSRKFPRAAGSSAGRRSGAVKFDAQPVRWMEVAGNNYRPIPRRRTWVFD